jgi:hypothetical protein
MMMLVIANIGAEDHRKGDDLRQQDFPNWTFFCVTPRADLNLPM